MYHCYTYEHLLALLVFASYYLCIKSLSHLLVWNTDRKLKSIIQTNKNISKARFHWSFLFKQCYWDKIKMFNNNTVWLMISSVCVIRIFFKRPELYPLPSVYPHRAAKLWHNTKKLCEHTVVNILKAMFIYLIGTRSWQLENYHHMTKEQVNLNSFWHQYFTLVLVRDGVWDYQVWYSKEV